MGSDSVRKKRTKKFMKASGRMTSNMVKVLRLLKTQIIVFINRYMMENGKTTKGKAKERSSTFICDPYSLANLQMVRRTERE